MIVTHVDDYTTFSRNHNKIKSTIELLKDEFKLTDEGYLRLCMGVDITKNTNDTWTLSQLFYLK